MSSGLFMVFVWWIQQINKVFALMKQIPIFPGISFFAVFIGCCYISVIISIIKFGMRVSNLVRWSDNTATYWNNNNINGHRNFGKPRRYR